MEPTVTLSEAELHQGDCLDVLPLLPDGSIDAVVMDPPYGIGFAYNGVREVNNHADYWAWLAPRYRECLRALAPGGFVAVWQTQLYFRHFWDWFGNDIHIYAACKNFVQIRPTSINHGYDPVVMLYKAGPRPLRPVHAPRSLDFYVGNTAGVISDRGRVEKVHPCPRPVDAVREIVINFTADGGTVLDPFMGSGTTGLAALSTGRRFVGVEIDPHYFEVARKRLTECDGPLFSAQPSLFPGEATPCP